MIISKNESDASWVLITNNWLIQITRKFSWFFIATSLAMLMFFWPKLPPQIPLWYSKPWGTEQLASPAFLFILPIGSGLFYTFNYLIGKYLTHEYLIFTQSLFISSLIMSFLSFLSLLKIILIIV